MSLEESFADAAVRVKGLSARPSNESMLSLYAYYKQGHSGEVSGKRPGMMNMVARAKYDAWANLEGMSSDEAKQSYVDLVKKLEKEELSH